MRKLLALNGLRDSDYRVIEFVGTPERSECLRKGQCDGVPLGQPEDFLLLKQGYRGLGISTDAVPNFQFIVSATRRSWAEGNKGSVVRYIRGLAAAFRFMRASANRDEVVKIIQDTTGSSEEIMREILKLYFEPDRGVFPKQGELDLKGLGQVIQFMAETGDLSRRCHLQSASLICNTYAPRAFNKRKSIVRPVGALRRRDCRSRISTSSI